MPGMQETQEEMRRVYSLLWYVSACSSRDILSVQRMLTQCHYLQGACIRNSFCCIYPARHTASNRRGAAHNDEIDRVESTRGTTHRVLDPGPRPFLAQDEIIHAPINSCGNGIDTAYDSRDTEVLHWNIDDGGTPHSRITEELYAYAEQNCSNACPRHCRELPSMEGVVTAIGRSGMLDAAQVHNTSLWASSCGNISRLIRPVELFPDFEPRSYELFQHYIERTAISLSNNSTSINPFVTEIVLLAMSNTLILQLLLAQSAAHKNITQPCSTKTVAIREYIKSAKIFRGSLSLVTLDPIVLAMAALIFCFIETTRGDGSGAVFEHLSAATALTSSAASHSSTSFSSGLKQFMVEYYTYATALNLISTDVRSSKFRGLCQSVLAEAHELVAGGYMGHLCGCWLELLLLIPRVFDLGQRVLLHDEAATETVPTVRELVDFVSLHNSITTFSPPKHAPDEILAAGLVYQQTLLIYLWMILTEIDYFGNGRFHSSINQFVLKALFHLDRIPSDGRVGAGLCWPIVVLGSVTQDQQVRDDLHARLVVMSKSVQLGNIQQTIHFLGDIWSNLSHRPSPWTLAKAMCQRGEWISFA